jgi:hypothetical protein
MWLRSMAVREVGDAWKRLVVDACERLAVGASRRGVDEAPTPAYHTLLAVPAALLRGRPLPRG